MIFGDGVGAIFRARGAEVAAGRATRTKGLGAETLVAAAGALATTKEGAGTGAAMLLGGGWLTTTAVAVPPDKVCSSALARVFTSSQFAARGVSASQAR